jgi:hypothetical protein
MKHNNCIEFSEDGFKFFVIDDKLDFIREYTLSEKFKVQSAKRSYFSFDIAGVIKPTSLYFFGGGKFMNIYDEYYDGFHMYVLKDGFELLDTKYLGIYNI